MNRKPALSLRTWIGGGLVVLACSPAADRPPPPLPPAISATAPAEPDGPPPAVTLEIALLDGDPSRLAVRMSVPHSVLPRGTKRLELPFMDAPFRSASGFGAFIKLTDGSEFTGQYDVPASATATELALDTAYTVHLTHEQAGPRQGVDEVPFKTTAGWFLAGRAFIPTLKADGVLLDLPMRVVFPHSSVSDAAGPLPEAGRDGANSALRDAFYVFGESNQKDVQAAGSTFRLMSGDLTPDSSAKKLVRDTVTLASAQLGPLEPHPRLVALNLRPNVRAGGSVGYDTSVVGPEPPDGPHSRLGQILIHELLHQWSQADVMWLSEGLTHYFELKAANGVDGLSAPQSEQQVLERFLPEFDAYQLEAQGRPLREAQGNAAYSGGAMLAYCLDVDLVQAGSSLEAVYRAARKKSGARVTSEKQFREALSKTPSALKRLDELLAVAGPFPLVDCLTRGGTPVKATQYTGLELRALAVDVLKVSGFNLWDNLVESVPEGSKFHAGDALLRVNGETVRHFLALPWLLRAVKPGQRMKFVVQRGEATETVELSMPRLDAAKRSQRTHLEPDSSAPSGPSVLFSWSGAQPRR